MSTLNRQKRCFCTRSRRANYHRKLLTVTHKETRLTWTFFLKNERKNSCESGSVTELKSEPRNRAVASDSFTRTLMYGNQTPRRSFQTSFTSGSRAASHGSTSYKWAHVRVIFLYIYTHGAGGASGWMASVRALRALRREVFYRGCWFSGYVTCVIDLRSQMWDCLSSSSQQLFFPLPPRGKSFVSVS